MQDSLYTRDAEAVVQSTTLENAYAWGTYDLMPPLIEHPEIYSEPSSFAPTRRSFFRHITAYFPYLSSSEFRAYYLGPLLFVIATAFLSVMALLSKKASEWGIPASLITLFRCSFQALVLTVYMLINRIRLINPYKPFLIALRGVVDATQVFLFLYAVDHLALVYATVLGFTTPLFAGAIGHLWLGEKYSAVDIPLNLLTISAIALISKATYGVAPVGTQETVAIAAAIASAVSQALSYCIIRYIGTSAHYLEHAYAFGLYGSFVGLVASALLKDLGAIVYLSNSMPLLLTSGSVLCGLISQLLIMKGAQMVSAAVATTLRTSEIVYSCVFQAVFFPDFNFIPPIYVGCIIVVISLWAFVACKQMQHKRGEDEEQD